MTENWKERTSNFWKPEKEGDEIVGTLTSIRDGTFGDVYDIDTKDGLVTVPTSAVLSNRISENDVGKEIKIVYDGEQAPSVKGHNPTKIFKVYFKE